MQIVFTDTPGFHKPRTLLGSRLNELVGDAVDGVDVVILVVDGASGVGRGDAYVAEQQVARPERGARFCVVNKIDRLDTAKVIPQLAAAQALGAWDEIVPVSAQTGDGVDAAPRPHRRAPAGGSAAVSAGRGHGSAAGGAPRRAGAGAGACA